MVVATPSGITLAPEGGAHQSIHTPLIGIGQPGLAYFEPAYADELSAIMRWGFEHMQAKKGGSVYLRLSTRTLDQLPRTLTAHYHADIIAGGYWLRRPQGSTPLALAYAGAIAPEVMSAVNDLMESYPGLGVLAVTSPDRLYNEWCAAREARVDGDRHISHVEALLSALSVDAGIVTVIDGHPLSLSWLGGVQRNPVHPLGVRSFGQSGDIQDLYATHHLDATSIVRAAHAAAGWARPR